MPEAQPIKRINIKEFRAFGYLQEVNRLFLHPLGLALEVVVDEDDGSEKLGGIWDYRDDPEGLIFANEDRGNDASKNRAKRVEAVRQRKAKSRQDALGYVIQEA